MDTQQGSPPLEKAETIRPISFKRTGLGVLLVEQNSAKALEIASCAFVLETGMITLSGPSAILADDPRIPEVTATESTTAFAAF